MPDEKNESLLKEIRENFDWYNDAWREIHDEGGVDMQYLAGDPWTQAEKDERKDAGRPIVSFDELTQYVNQIVNDARMNKRGIKVDAKGEGASEDTAESRESLIRGIEYESNAQTAYTTAFEGAVQRGYGYARVNKDYVSSKSFNQVIRIRRIPNPDSVLMDPMCKEADCSDAEGCFVIDVLKPAAFKRKYPKAETKSFETNDFSEAPNWLQDGSVVVAEYWKVIKKQRTMVLLDNEEQSTVYVDDIEGAKLKSKDGEEYLETPKGTIPVKVSRKCEERKVVQYITNGVEILETNPQDGHYIPIIPCWGREMYVDEGGGSKRMLFSLIRLARAPYKTLCYIRAQELEEAAMTPRVPWMVYEGQIEGHDKEYERAHNQPVAFLQAKAKTDSTGDQILPLPTRPQFQPNFQTYEFFAESLKKAIQSACGMYNSSVGKHDTNAKSGKAIDALESQSSQGNFHFIDNYDRFIQHVGRVIDDLIPSTYDTPREVGMRKADDSHEMVKANDPDDEESVDLTTGEHDVNVSTGPSFNSQRDAAEAFADSFMNNLEALPISPEQKTQLIAQVVKLKNLGPIGDQMVEILIPDKNQPLPPEAQQAMGKMQQELQLLNAYAKQLEEEKKQLEMEKQAKVVENQYRLQIVEMQESTKLAVAEISTKAQQTMERMNVLMDAMKHIEEQQHEFTMQKDQQEHEAGMAQQQADNASVSQQTQIAADQQSQAAQQQSSQ